MPMHFFLFYLLHLGSKLIQGAHTLYIFFQTTSLQKPYNKQHNLLAQILLKGV